VIRWSYCSPIGVSPGADGILDALSSLTPGQRGANSETRGRESPAAESTWRLEEHR